MTTFPNSHPEGSGMCHSLLSLNVCHQHRILGFVNRTVLQLLALLQHFGICYHQNASSECWKDESDLVPRQGYMPDIRVTAIQTSWLCGKVGCVSHCSVLLWEMLFWISKCTLCILTLQSTFMISSLLIELKICYHQCQFLPLHTNLSQFHPYPSFTTYYLKCVLLLSSQMAFFQRGFPNPNS